MAVYFKRMAQRFHELGLLATDDGGGGGGGAGPGGGGAGAVERGRRLVVARMDVTDEAPPAALGFQLASLPALAILPAADKQVAPPVTPSLPAAREAPS